MNIEILYHNIWLWSSFAFCVFIFIIYGKRQATSILHRKNINSFFSIVYCIVFAIWIGFRPMRLAGWADSMNYARVYYQIQGFKGATDDLIVDTDSEWLWDFIMRTFSLNHLPIEWWFFLIACCYIGFMYLGIRKMMPNNQWIALLFCISSFSFFTFSYNGLRNGMACSMIIYALSFLIDFNKKGLIFFLIISFLAMGIHRSSALPIACAIICYVTKLDFRWAFGWWIFSIILSLLFGSEIQNFFANLGFDDRMKDYAGKIVSDQATAKQFNHTGFRWDFLLYSFMPILLGYYICLKRGIRDRAYSLLIGTYILANSFWVMVIQAAYSNRFAYLSWFLYPIVFAYPLLKIKIWRDQDRKTALILLAFISFTVILNLLYW